MNLAEFLILQSELFAQFGWFIRWWFILLAVGGFGLAVFLFFLQLVSIWLNDQ
jgi:hypothetical protein